MWRRYIIAIVSLPLFGAPAVALDLKIRVDKVVERLGRAGAIYGSSPVLDTAKRTEINKILLDVGVNPKVIYGVNGQDDRWNFFQATAIEQKAASTTAIMVTRSDILESGAPDQFNLPSKSANLCEGERFRGEPAPGVCSAFRIGKDLLATAGHCVRDAHRCAQISFVFDFQMKNDAHRPERSILAKSVYHCAAVVDARLDGPPGQSDWSVVRVDREIDASVPIVSLRQTGSVTTGDVVTVVGYPMGLPVKITRNGFVRRLDKTYFVANPDTYGGNSGSPVFNTVSLEKGELLVEGILVRGEDDFNQVTPCKRSKYCPEAGCRGEDVTYVSEFLPALPK